jgi:hypothetical protein
MARVQGLQWAAGLAVCAAAGLSLVKLGSGMPGRSSAVRGWTPAAPVSEAGRRLAREALGKLPLYFVENRGQADSRVAAA